MLYRCYDCARIGDDIIFLQRGKTQIGYAEQEKFIPLCSRCFKRTTVRKIEVH
ncbi:hypothetical protein J4410_06910 [Candidatus Woesearchaeota archaeon]|nr:hypothetical protein [Candidatus Woesearchaeota archaeon]